MPEIEEPSAASGPPARLDAEALALFAHKGLEAGADAPQVGEGNAPKVRRVVQLTHDLVGGSMAGLSLLDLGCGEGVYAIEAGLRGAEVLALDARTERMREGAACAARHGLGNVVFRQRDIRQVSRTAEGEFDVVYCLGLIYHLEASDGLALLEKIHALCLRLLVIDTLISLEPEVGVRYRGQTYEGQRVREHQDEDPADVRRARPLRSIDNTFAFRFTRTALIGALREAGFTSVLECHVPLEPGKAEDRITLAALKGERAPIATYPWINDLSEEEIERRLGGA